MRKVANEQTDKQQTNNDDYISSLAEVKINLIQNISCITYKVYHEKIHVM